MPSNYENSVGWLALKLRAQRLQQLQEQDLAIQQQGRAATQQQINAIPQILHNQQALDAQKEALAQNLELKREIAHMNALAKAKDEKDRSDLKTSIAAMLEEGRNRRAANALEGQNTRSEHGITSRESEGAQNRALTASEGEKNRQAGFAKSDNAITGNSNFPEARRAAGGVTDANPSGLPKASYKELQDRKISLENGVRRAKEVEAILNSPDAQESDFGAAGTELPAGIPVIGGASINSMQGLLNKVTHDKKRAAAVARRQRITQAYANSLVPSLTDIGGKQLTPFEAGGGLAQAGIDYDPESKKFIANPFRNPLPIARSGIKNHRENLEKELNAVNAQLNGGADVPAPHTSTTQIMPTGNPDQLAVTPMPLPAQPAHEHNYQKDLAEAKARISNGRLDPASAAKIMGAEYPNEFKPEDLR